MGMIRALRMLNSLVDGTMNAAQLETALTTGGKAGDFAQFTALSSQSAILANSSTAAAAIVGSETARSILTKSSVLFKAFAASPFAQPSLSASVEIATLAANNLAIARLAVSSGLFALWTKHSNAIVAAFASQSLGREAIWESDKALIAVRDNLYGVTGLKAVSGYGETSRMLASTLQTVDGLTGKRIILEMSYDYSGTPIIYVTGLRAGTSFSGEFTLPASNVKATRILPVQSPVQARNYGGGNAPLYFGNLPV